MIDQPQITPMAVMVAVYQGLMEENAYSAETTYRVQGAVKLGGYPTVKLNSLVAPTDALPANLQAALALGERFTSGCTTTRRGGRRLRAWIWKWRRFRGG